VFSFSPGNVILESKHLLLLRKPFYHLGKLVMLVECTPPLLSKINVKLFKHFCVIIVGGAKILDGLDVVDEAMEFWDVKILVYASLDKV
jgi:hypothetical protein